MCNVGLDRETFDRAQTHHGAYEIQFRVPASLVGDDELRTLLVGLGTDVVIASTADELAAHLHVSDPHPATAAISAALEGRPGVEAISYDVEAIIVSGPLV